MATAYDYYQATYPDWGRAQLQFRSPPPPSFQPLPTWTGFDYYRAHAYNPDYGLFSSIMNRTRDMGYNGGYDAHEAKVWQRRVYSGLVNLGQILPSEIGAAAAYEAYRMWKHQNGALFEPLGGARDREREALIGLAIAEASRLWAYSGRPMDTYGQRDCLESSALTASRIASTMLYDQGYAQGGYGREYGYDDPRRGRRYSNASQSMGLQQGYGGVSGAAPMPIPGAGIGTGYPGTSPYVGSMGGSPYHGGGVPAYADSAGSGYGGRGLPGSVGSYGNNAGGFVPPPLSARRSPSPFLQAPAVGGVSPYMGAVTTQQYPQAGYGGAPGAYGGAGAYPGAVYGQPAYASSQNTVYRSGSGTTTIPAAPGSTIIITKGRPHRLVD